LIINKKRKIDIFSRNSARPAEQTGQQKSANKLIITSANKLQGGVLVSLHPVKK